MAKYRIVREPNSFSEESLFRVYHNEGFPFGWEFIALRESLEGAKEAIEIHKNNPVYEE